MARAFQQTMAQKQVVCTICQEPDCNVMLIPCKHLFHWICPAFMEQDQRGINTYVGEPCPICKQKFENTYDLDEVGPSGLGWWVDISLG